MGNRRLTVLLKDDNKMDLNILRNENDNLKREDQAFKNHSSVHQLRINNLNSIKNDEKAFELN